MKNLDPVVVQHYAVLKGISQSEAKDKLRENYEAEVKEIPAKDLALRAITGMRSIAPKVDAMSQREQGTITKIRQLENGMLRIARQLEADSNLRERIVRLEDELEKYKEDSKRNNFKIENMYETMERKKVPWYRKLYNLWLKKTK